MAGLNGALVGAETLSGQLASRHALSGTLAPVQSVSGTLAIGEKPYAGPMTITPTTSAQTIPIANRRVTQDIIVEAIPNNYGLISWDGSILTVS